MAQKPRVLIPKSLYYRHEGFRWLHSDQLEGGWEVETELLPFLKTLPSPQRYLQKVAPDYGWARLLLQHGKRMAVSPYQHSKKQEQGECYNNALRVRRHAVNEMGGRIWHYTEGVAITPNGAQLHGWNTIAGQVFDTTWHHPHGAKYFGITFTDEFMQWLMFATARPHAMLMRTSQTATYIDNFCRTHGKGGLRT